MIITRSVQNLWAGDVIISDNMDLWMPWKVVRTETAELGKLILVHVQRIEATNMGQTIVKPDDLVERIFRFRKDDLVKICAKETSQVEGLPPMDMF